MFHNTSAFFSDMTRKRLYRKDAMKMLFPKECGQKGHPKFKDKCLEIFLLEQLKSEAGGSIKTGRGFVYPPCILLSLL